MAPYLLGTLAARWPRLYGERRFRPRMSGAVAALRRAAPAVTVATAAVLVALGVLLVTDRLGWVSARLRA
jgi:hypothetical protein